ncbi:hypothetical protein J7384_17850 [Endozoicomonas sp. G2_1]|uniref:hypothetical protein n=1 Tax=Endozoicomonas sp. G2_1 TaxID=2821091 RepID=UPI001AD9F2CE|nr:hypothetical protein [Endozoicomonas sp. G2_1]MBO9492230.1 hypothetical protein [Endozoicomonas sp. G2_1]
MPELRAPSLSKTSFNGHYGNKSSFHGHANLASTPVDTVVQLGEFGAGIRVDDIKAVTKNLGAGTSLQLGVQYPQSATADEPNKFTTITTTSDKTTRYDGAPVYIDEPCILTATVKGASATGAIDIVFDYVFEGN